MILKYARLRKVVCISYGAHLLNNFLHFSFVEEVLRHIGLGPTPR
jgi:hypothetical protein